MSEFGYENYGYDDGSEAGGVTASEIAAAAAQQVANTYGPVIAEQNDRLNQLTGALVQQARAGNDAAAERQHKIAEEGVNLAGERFDPRWWSENRAALTDTLSARPELLPEQALGAAGSTADAIEVVGRIVEREQAQQTKRRNAEQADLHLREMKRGLGKTRYWE